jgi:hypothetical protein
LELLLQVFDHPGDLAADLAGPLPGRVDGPGLLSDVGLSCGLLLAPLPCSPRRGPGVRRVVAVLGWSPGASLSGHRRPLTAGVAARALLGLRD